MTTSDPEAEWDHRTHIEAEDRMREAIHDAYIAVATSTLDRMLRRADSVVRVAGAAGTIYTAILGVAYAYGAVSFTAWALVPAVLVAVALVLGATYVGYVQTSPTKFQPLATGLSTSLQHQRLSDLIDWVNSISLRRAWAMRSSVASLGLGVASMPIAFLSEFRSIAGWAVLALCLGWVALEVVRAGIDSRARSAF